MVTSVPFEFEGGSSIQIERQRAHKRVDGADVRESTSCNGKWPNLLTQRTTRERASPAPASRHFITALGAALQT